MTSPADNDPYGIKNAPPTPEYHLPADQNSINYRSGKNNDSSSKSKNRFQNDWVIGEYHCSQSAKKHILLTGFQGGNALPLIFFPNVKDYGQYAK